VLSETLKSNRGMIAAVGSAVLIFMLFPELAKNRWIIGAVAVSALFSVIEVAFFFLFTACRQIGCFKSPDVSFVALRAVVALSLVTLTFVMDATIGRVVILAGAVTGPLLFAIAVVADRSNEDDLS
jgi:hypothetical protein